MIELSGAAGDLTELPLLALTFGQTLRKLLSERRLTIRAFARRCELHPTHLGRVLQDTSTPRAATISRMIDALAPIDPTTAKELYALSGHNEEAPFAHLDQQTVDVELQTDMKGLPRQRMPSILVRKNTVLITGNFAGLIRCTIHIYNRLDKPSEKR